MITLPALPFEKSALEPYISADTIEYHYHHHHKGYVDTVNKLVADNTEYQNLTLKQLMDLPATADALHAAAYQVYNHNLFWSTLTTPTNSANASSELTKLITECFGGWMKFKREVQHRGMELIGSGWLWIVITDGKLEIHTTHNQYPCESNPASPVLFVIDLWEHSYYLDTPANKQKYLSNIWYILNWNVINDRFNTYCNQN